MNYHSGTIHSVRFSPNGKYLASGADDKIVCVYTLDPNPPTHTTFGSHETPPVENWRIFRRLIGHDNDVQDLGWSYDSSVLVSVGLDSKVVVWSGHTFEKLKTISHHQSHVKGLTFDPANKYFATASDDRTVKIYRFTSPAPNANAYDQANNFVLESTVSAPFAASPLTTYFRRCSWSPDGAHIAAANAVNGPVSSVAVIDRGSWSSDINLIGHEGPVEVCAFSPRLFCAQPPPPVVDGQDYVAPPTVTIIACAGQDKTLSVWNTSFPRPFVITHELAAKSISDLAWSPDGEKLFLTSLDGTIAAVFFERGELGYPAPETSNDKSLAKYGAGRRAGLVEGADGLLLEESSKADELKGVQGRMGELMGDNTSQPILALNGNTEKVNDSTNGAGTADATNGANGTAAKEQPPAAPKPVDPQVARIDKLKQRRKFAEIDGDEDRRAEKRIASVQQAGAAPIVMNTAAGLVPPSLAAKSAAAETPEVLRPAIVNPSLTVSQVRLAVPLVRTVILRPLDGNLPVEPDGTNGQTGDSNEEPSVVFEARNAAGPARTGRPQDREPTRINVSKRGQSLWQDYLARAVLLVTGNHNLWAAACEDGSLHVWTPAGRRLINALILESQPVILDCRGWWLLCVTAAGQCYIWNVKTLSSPHPPISLAPVLDIASAVGQQHLTTSPAVMFARLNSQGRIIVAMSNGDGFTYSPSMFVWQRLSEPWWAIGSQYWNTTDTSISTVATSSSSSSSGKQNGNADDDADHIKPENISAGIIPLLERNTTSQSLLRGRAYFLQRLVKSLLSAEGFEGFESTVSIAHLENRVAAAMTLGAKEEFRLYLMMYAKRIGAEGLRGKVEELLRGLMGKMYEDGEEDGEGDRRMVGWKREELLREVVLILGKHRDLQRITVPYARFLGVLGKQEGGATPMVTEM
ncbi:HIR complex subunit [Taxawa tesnikishii (nom. ined.)]|nr:HIR complex subunit [Dothideales sp. JES 119]